MRDDQDFLEDILERIRLTVAFTAQGRDAFFASRLTQEAVVRNLEVIGEASRSLSDELRQRHQIKLDRVWQIVEHDLMPLSQQIAAILDEQAR